jgi:hypothetical protein
MNTKWHNLRQRCNYLLVWIKRAARSRGFGVQSPTDYWIVRYVINEHWPYYQYDTIGCGDPWLRRKLGKLYFRLANWRQPAVVTTDDYQDYFLAGCRKAAIGKQGQLVRLTLDDGWQTRLNEFLDRANQQSVLVVEGIVDHRWWKTKSEKLPAIIQITISVYDIDFDEDYDVAMEREPIFSGNAYEYIGKFGRGQ